MKVLDKEVDTVLQKIKEIIIREIDPDSIILFGSRARGDNHKDSDYDISVLKSGIEGENRKIKHRLYIALFEAREAVDLIVSTPEKFELSKENKYLVYKNIFEEGRIVYEKSR